MKFTVEKLIIYSKQIERINKEQTIMQANAIGLASSKDGDNPKGGEN